MVFSEAAFEEKDIHQHQKTMSKRSKPLHNFSLPNLKWGNQRFLRCMKVNSKGEIVSSSSDLRSSGSEGDFDDNNNNQDLKLGKQRSLNSLPQESSRPKLKIHLHTASAAAATDKSRNKISPISGADENQEDESRVASGLKPWNLRTRRAACKEPNNETAIRSPKRDELQQHQNSNNGGGSPNQKMIENPSPKSSIRLKGLAATAAANHVMVNERREFSRALSKDEIKYDFVRLTGNNPPRRPKKRSKIVQKQLDSLLPGFWLTEVTTDTYRLPDEIV